MATQRDYRLNRKLQEKVRNLERDLQTLRDEIRRLRVPLRTKIQTAIREEWETREESFLTVLTESVYARVMLELELRDQQLGQQGGGDGTTSSSLRLNELTDEVASRLKSDQENIPPSKCASPPPLSSTHALLGAASSTPNIFSQRPSQHFQHLPDSLPSPPSSLRNNPPLPHSQSLLGGVTQCAGSAVRGVSLFSPEDANQLPVVEKAAKTADSGPAGAS